MNEPFESSQKTTINENQGHKGPPKEWGSIVVGTDGSLGAARAIDVASILAADLNVDLWIANVMDKISDADLTSIARAENTSKGDVAEVIARRLLADASRRSESNGAKKIHTVLLAGDSADALIAAARNVGASAIFVGRRGAGGRISEALVGSVSQKLAGLSPVMLAVIP